MLRKRTSYVWNQVPLLRPVAPFLLGLLVGLTLPLDFDTIVFAVSALLCWCLLLLPWPFAWTRACIAMLVFLLAGTALGSIHRQSIHYQPHSWTTSQQTLRAVVMEPFQAKESSYKTIIQLTHRVGQDDIVPLDDMKVLTYVEKDSSIQALAAGTVIVFKARLQPLAERVNPFAFDYGAYMAKRNVHLRTYIPAASLHVLGQLDRPRFNLLDWQASLIKAVRDSQLPDEVQGLMIALMLGDKRELSVDQRDAFAQAGVMHVLAVSGLHVGIIYLMLSTLFFFLTHHRWSRWLRVLLLFLSLWLFAGITGFSPSVTRAATMFSFIVLGEAMSRKGGVFHALLGSALLLLCFEPGLLLEVGFQLSYVAVFGIVALQPMVYAWFGKSRWWLVDKVWALTSVSLAAQVATFPLALYYFHQFPLYFLLSNLMVIPIASALLPAGIAYLLLNQVSLIGSLLAEAIAFLGVYMNDGVSWIKALPFAALDGFYIQLHELYLLYMGIMLLVYYLITKRSFWLGMTLVSSILLIASATFSYWSTLNSKELWFYRSTQGDVLSFVHGERVHTIATAVFWQSEYDKQSVEAHWAALDIPDEHRSQDTLQEVYYLMGGIRVIIPSTEIEWLNEIPADILWVTIPVSAEPLDYLELHQPRWVILSAGLDSVEKEAWIRAAGQRGIQWRDLEQDAPFSLCLSPKCLGKGEAVF